MIPLSQQLYNPLAVVFIILHLALLVGPLVALWYAAPRQRAVAIGLAAAAVAARLVHITLDPPAVSLDETGTLLAVGRAPVWTFRLMFGEWGENGISIGMELPWYILYRLTNSLVAIRVVGLAWAAGVTIYAFLFGARFFGTAGGAVAAAVLSFTPWSLFLSRYSLGHEIILQELYLFAAVERLRQQPGWASAFVCGLMLALLQSTYLAARIAIVFPIALLMFGPWPQFKRTVAFATLAYVIAGLGVLPHLATHPQNFWGSGAMMSFNPNSADWRYMLLNAGRVLGSLAWWQDSVSGTFAMVGAQTFPPFVLATIILGAIVSLAGVGRQFLLAAVIGAVPCWVSTTGGNSHRMMMMLPPLALLAGAAPLVVPVPHRGLAAAVLVAATAFTGMRTWLLPDFWTRAGIPRSAVWTPPLRTLVLQELARSPDLTVRVYPNEGSVRLLAAERGLSPFAFDLKTADFGSRSPLTVFWRHLRPAAQEFFQQAAADGELLVGPIAGTLTRTHLPRGWQGLVGDPPQFGWHFSMTCEHPTAEGGLDFVMPLLFEGSPASGQEPCTLQWSARARERLDDLLIESLLIRQGTVRIDDVTLLVKPITPLPTITAGQRISVEVSFATGGSYVVLRTAQGSLLSWKAVRPAI